MGEEYFSDVCDKTFSRSIKKQHEKTKSHIQPSLSVVNRFFIENVSVKLLTFKCSCEFKNGRFSSKMMLRWLCKSNVFFAGKLQSIYSRDRNELVHMKIVFITNLENQSYRHYLQQPKPMVDWKLIRLMNGNPNLIKKNKKMPRPFSRELIINYRGPRRIFNRVEYKHLPSSWLENEPQNNNGNKK